MVRLMSRQEMLDLEMAGINPIVICMNKYKRLGDAIECDEDVPRDAIKSDSCALCKNYYKISSCPECPLTKISQRCEDQDSVWFKLSTVIHDDATKETKLKCNNEMIDVLKLAGTVTHKIGKITIKVIPTFDVDDVMLEIDGMKHIANIIPEEYHHKSPYCSHSKSSNSLVIVTKQDGAVDFNREFYKPRDRLGRLMNEFIYLNKPVSSKTAKEIIELVTLCSERLHELNEINYEQTPIHVVRTNVIAHDTGEIKQTVLIEGLTSFINISNEFKRNRPYYDYHASGDVVYVYTNDTSFMVYVDNTKSYPPEYVDKFLVHLTTAIERERSIKKKLAEIKALAGKVTRTKI